MLSTPCLDTSESLSIEEAVTWVLRRFVPGDRIWASVVAQQCDLPVGEVSAVLLKLSNAGRLVRRYEVKCPRCRVPTETPVFNSLGDVVRHRFSCLDCETPFLAGPDDVYVFYSLST